MSDLLGAAAGAGAVAGAGVCVWGAGVAVGGSSWRRRLTGAGAAVVACGVMVTVWALAAPGWTCIVGADGAAGFGGAGWKTTAVL